MTAIVLLVTVAGYLLLLGWHRLQEYQTGKVWALIGVLAALAGWYGWCGQVAVGALAQALILTVMWSVDATTSSTGGGDGMWLAGAGRSLRRTALVVANMGWDRRAPSAGLVKTGISEALLVPGDLLSEVGLSLIPVTPRCPGHMHDAQRVAWVTGASRGVGRGVALALGNAGWTVYVTARSSTSRRTGHLPGTVQECAEAVTGPGGVGIAMVCDHRDDEAVAAVAEEIAVSHGRLDLLVNNAWAGYERLNAGAWQEWNAPLWEQPIELFDSMFNGGIRAHWVALAAGAPLLISTVGSAVVTISFDVSSPGETFGAAYSAAKCADDRLAMSAASQLRPHGVASLVVHPGLVRTEGVMQFAEHLDLTGSQSPEGVGRAVVAMIEDQDLMQCRDDLSRSQTLRSAAA
ncbi:MAG TPA: SDR family NAD(P)-dependent oxidoreductase [Jatrophihabitans sp.]